jgi:putative transposase
MTKHSPFRYFKTSPEIFRLAVMLYVRFPLSLRNVEDLLHERDVDINYEAILYWWRRFGSQFASEIQLLIFTAKDRFRDRFFKMATQ